MHGTISVRSDKGIGSSFSLSVPCKRALNPALLQLPLAPLCPTSAPLPPTPVIPSSTPAPPSPTSNTTRLTSLPVAIPNAVPSTTASDCFEGTASLLPTAPVETAPPPAPAVPPKKILIVEVTFLFSFPHQLIPTLFCINNLIVFMHHYHRS